MGFSGAVQWWDEWPLRILVLGSLFVQYMLFVSAAVRRCALPPLLRLFIWLAYLGGDALAIYALATLFNRNKQQGQQHAGRGLEVLWAPVLLIHLGGQHMMTAYSVEENELWRRHAITVVSQVTIALYVFCKSWSREKRLIHAAILLFVVGTIRSSQKPWNNIFMVACDDVEFMLGLVGELPRDERGIAQGILAGEQRPLEDGANIIRALLSNACKLAKALMELYDEGERWNVVQEVWVEMLCYSAGRCSGYMHAKSMSEGPELLSHVWFILSFMGMETFADRFQKLEPPDE
ncbi:hypothetical protein ACQ4PT_057088 [Festuca glaucescens]